MKVNEIFGPTLQGEGPSAGQQAVFLRLTGCNLRCAKCDTKYAFDEGTEMDALDVLVELKKHGVEKTRYVVVTGGEPLLQSKELSRVITHTVGVQFGIETNGTIFEMLDGTREGKVHYTVSPKGFGFGDPKGRELFDDQWAKVTQFPGIVHFKFVVSTEGDVKSVQQFVEQKGIHAAAVWLMPEGVTREKIFNKWPDVFEWAVEYGFHGSCRLHTLAFGAKRGV